MTNLKDKIFASTSLVVLILSVLYMYIIHPSQVIVGMSIIMMLSSYIAGFFTSKGKDEK